MNTTTLVTSVGLLVIAAGCVLAQPAAQHTQVSKSSLSTPGDKNANPAPYTPEQEAIFEQQAQFNADALLALNENRYSAVEDIARKSAELDGQGAAFVKELLALALFTEGKDRAALDAYQEVIEHYDTQPRSLLPYALLELKAGDWTKAVNAYNAALVHLPAGKLMVAHSHFNVDNPQPQDLATALHIALGLTFYSSDFWQPPANSERSLAEYRKALDLEPNSPLANLYYADGLRHAGRKDEAKAAFHKTADMSSGDIKTEAIAGLQGLPISG